MGRQGPAPLWGGAEGRPLRDSTSSLTSLPWSRQPTAARAPGRGHIRDGEAAAVRQERRLSGQNDWEGAHEGPTGQTLRSQEGAQSGASG